MELKPGYKKTEVGVIPEDWKVVALSAACSMKSGEGITSSKIDLFSQYPCYGGNGLRGFTSRFTHDGSYALIGRQGALCGNVLGVEGKFFASEHAVVVTAHPQTDISWLTYVLGEMHLNRFSESSAQPGLSVSKVLKLGLALPSTKDEQRAIAETLSDVDALLRALERLIAKKRDLKQAAMQQLLTGLTRLPGFHGEWVVKRLEKNCEKITKGTTPTSIGRDFTESGVNFLKAESFSESGEPIASKVAFIDTSTHKLLKRSQLKEGDLLISIAGVLGRVGCITRNILPANTNQALAIVRLGASSELERSFLFYYLRSSMTKKQIDDVTVQAAQANISLQNVRDLEIQVPPTRAEQTAIATVLSDMDAELAALEQRREKTRALKQAMMQELLTGRTRLV